MEIICKDCGRKFYRKIRRGRKPVRCVFCQEKVKDAWREKQKEK